MAQLLLVTTDETAEQLMNESKLATSLAVMGELAEVYQTLIS
jgi:hypothetical protein